MSDAVLQCCCRTCCGWYVPGGTSTGTVTVVISGFGISDCAPAFGDLYFRDDQRGFNGSWPCSVTASGGSFGEWSGTFTMEETITFYTDDTCSEVVETQVNDITVTVSCFTSFTHLTATASVTITGAGLYEVTCPNTVLVFQAGSGPANFAVVTLG